MPAFKKVLFIDDDIITAKVCERVMKLVDFAADFITCEDGKVATEYLLDNTNALPDIIFVDLNMHVMNGWEFVKWFNESVYARLNIPLYVLSSSLNNEDYKKIDGYKTAGFITKPVAVEHLNQIAAKYST